MSRGSARLAGSDMQVIDSGKDEPLFKASGLDPAPATPLDATYSVAGAMCVDILFDRRGRTLRLCEIRP